MTYLDKRERTMSRQFKCKDPNISRLENWTVLTNIHQRCLNLVRDGDLQDLTGGYSQKQGKISSTLRSCSGSSSNKFRPAASGDGNVSGGIVVNVEYDQDTVTKFLQSLHFTLCWESGRGL